MADSTNPSRTSSSIETPLTLLLIEDNPGDVRLIETLLAEANAERTAGPARFHPDHLETATTLTDGLERLESDDIDLVLLDLGLPESRGIETLATVRDRVPSIPVVVLTGLSDEEVGVEAVQRGAQGYLTKGELTPVLLRRSLRHAMERERFDRTQSALHEASRELIQTQSREEVAQVTVDAGLDALGLSGIVVYLFDEADARLRPVAYSDAMEHALQEEPPAFGAQDEALTWQAFIENEPLTIEDLHADERAHLTTPAFRSGMWIPLSEHGVFGTFAEQMGHPDPRTRQLADHLAATAEAALNRVERESALRENERQRARQNRELVKLHRMNQLIRDIDQVLVHASTREEIEQAVCARLADREGFAFAWIGDVAGETLDPRAWDGTQEGYLDAIPLGLDASDPPPAITAVTERESVLETVASDLGSATWRRAALAAGYASVLSVPLSYHEFSYGALTVFATEADAFEASSRKMFEELGHTIANAMNTIETRRALLTNTVVELELVVKEAEYPLGRLARATGCDIDYGGAVPQSDGATQLFFTASGAEPADVTDAAADISRISDIALIGEDEATAGAHRYEATIAGSTLSPTVLECGGVARAIDIEDTAIRVRVELPETTDVRTFIDRFEEQYQDVELVARRDRERRRQDTGALDTLLSDTLTDRQLETLQTAYFSGYFEWPRQRTGEEVAASLDITQPTFNAHLRAAERKLCELVFDRTQE